MPLFNNPDYLEAAINGNIEIIRNQLNAVYSHSTRRTTAQPYPMQRLDPESQKQALSAAIANHQMDVIILLLNYETSPGQRNLLTDQAKQSGISQAIQCGAHTICKILIEHLTLIRPMMFSHIKRQLSDHYANQPATLEAQHQLTEIILTLLNHPHLQHHPRRAFETLRDIGIKHTCVGVVQYLFDHGFKPETLNAHDQSLIASDFAETPKSLWFLEQFPRLQNIIDHAIEPTDLDTPFIIAARCNNLPLMQRIYSRDPSQLTKANGKGKTALIAAAESDIPAKDAIAWLMHMGMNITTRIDDKTTILDVLASNQAQYDAFELIMNAPNPAIDALLSDNETKVALFLRVLKTISHRVDRNTWQESIPPALLGPLFALSNRLIDRGAEAPSELALSARYFQKDAIASAMIRAPKGKISSAYHFLFNNAITLESKNRYRITPIDTRDRLGRTALHELMLNVPHQLIKLLRAITEENNNSHADITDEKVFEYRVTHSLIAMFTPDLALATFKKLCRHSPDINSKDNEGNTPLHLACLHHNSTLIEALLGEGADPNSQNNSGTTPFMLACQYANLTAIMTLIEKGGDPQLANDLGLTANDYYALNDLGIEFGGLANLQAILTTPTLGPGL